MDITISRSYSFSINVLLMFEMQDLNRTLFSDEISFSTFSSSLAAAAKRSIFSFTTIDSSP